MCNNLYCVFKSCLLYFLLITVNQKHCIMVGLFFYYCMSVAYSQFTAELDVSADVYFLCLIAFDQRKIKCLFILPVVSLSDILIISH